MSSRDAKMQYIITPVLFQIFSRMTADMPLTKLFDNVNTCQHKKTLLVLHTSIRDLLQNSCPTGTRLVKDHSCWCVIPVPFFMLTCIYTVPYNYG